MSRFIDIQEVNCGLETWNVHFARQMLRSLRSVMNMKEIIKPTLTNMSQQPYARGGPRFTPIESELNRGGEIFMEGKPDVPQNSQPASSEGGAEKTPQATKPGAEKPVSAENQAAARELLEIANLPVEVRGAAKEIIAGKNVPLVAGGAQEPEETPPPPPTGNQPEEPENDSSIFFDNLIRQTTNEQLKSILQKISSRIREIKSPADLRDEFIAEQMAAIRKLIDEKQFSGADGIIADDLMSQLSQLRMSKLSSLDRMAAQERDPELKVLAEEIIKVFSNDRVREELIKDNPNLNDLEELKHLIDKLIDPTRQDILILTNAITDENGISIQGKEKLVLSDKSKRLLYEWLVEKIISIPDSTPDAHYNIGSFYITANLDSILDTARRRFDGETSAYLNNLRYYRQAMHELNLALRVGEQYKEFVLKELSSNGFDFVNNRLVGVGGIIRLYEKAYANKVSEKRQWLTGQDVNEVEREVTQIVQDQYDKEEITDKEGRALTEWEKDRALRLGRILFSGSQRKAIYSGFGNLPPDTASRIGSLPDEYIVRSIYDWKIFAPRFYGSDPASRRFIQHVFEHARSLNPKKFDESVLGVKSDTLIENSFGGYDMQSHEWRSELLFLGNQLFFITEGGAKRTLQQILNSGINKYNKKGKTDERTKESIDEGVWGYPQLDDDKKKSKGKPTEKDKFSNHVRKIVLGQRVYLSSLVRYSNFSADLKADLWRRRASLMPSTAVTLLPDEILKPEEKELWENMRHRVYRAEERRIQEETLRGRSLRDVYVEAKRFERGKKAETPADRDLRYEFVNDYCQDKDGFSDAERRLIKEIIDRVYYQATGRNHEKLPGLAERLAETNMSFNLIIDDAPTIAWKKKGGEYGNAGFETADFIRLLASDQENFTKGWQPITALTESPQSANFEVFEKAVQPIADVIGRDSAQKKIEPFIAATAKMYSTDTTMEFIPGAMTLRRAIDKPTSEIERYFKKTYISWNAAERKNFFIKLLQVKALGNKGFERMRKETKSTQEWVLLTLFNFWVQLIGVEFAYQMFKAFLPEEMSKSLS